VLEFRVIWAGDYPSSLWTSPVRVFTMADLHHPHFKAVILDRVHDPIVTLTDTIAFLSCQLLTTRRPG
jgi:hypothetical protein